MDGLFKYLTYWHWLGLGLILLILEVLIASDGFLLWIGLAAFVTAIVALIVPTLFWGVQLLIFALGGIVCVVSWWSYLQRSPIQTDQPKLNHRGEQYVGRVFTLETAIENGRGTIHVDDTIWRVTGKDLPEGTKVKVIATDGIILRVAPVNN